LPNHQRTHARELRSLRGDECLAFGGGLGSHARRVGAELVAQLHECVGDACFDGRADAVALALNGGGDGVVIIAAGRR
jgi:hypothetical protein